MEKIRWVLVLTAMALIISSPCHADQWAISYGGIGEDSKSIQQTADGGYIVAGVTSFGPATNAWVLKLDAYGDIDWQKTYGGTDYDIAESIQQTADGGYIVAGWTESFGAGNRDAWVLKLLPDGTVAWQNTYGGTGWEHAESIQQTTDGGYIVAGWTSSFGAGSSDMWVLKLDAYGDIDWQNTYGGTGWEHAESIQQTTDGGYIVAGWTESFGAVNSGAWVLKLLPDGTVAWQNTYGGTDHDVAESIQQTTDGGYIVAGWTGWDPDGRDFWVLKLYPDGTVAWQNTYGGSASEGAESIQQTADGGYIVAGTSQGIDFSPGEHEWILKLDAYGDIVWETAYLGNSRGSVTERVGVRAIQNTEDGSYIVVCNAGDDGVCVLKLDANGAIPDCSDVVTTTEAIVSETFAALWNTVVVPQESTVDPGTTNVSPLDTSRQRSAACPRLIIDKIVLKDLDQKKVTKNFSPGTNISYKVKFTVDGDSNELYKVVVSGRAFSLYKPNGTNREWNDKFDNPKRKGRRLYGGESKRVSWNRQIPVDATPDQNARVKFTLKLMRQYGESPDTWNLWETYNAKKSFNIVP